MKLVMEEYGKLILSAVVAVSIVTFLFFHFSDEEKNKDFLSVLGARITMTNTNYHEYIDFKDSYRKESVKSAPTLTFSCDRLIVGTHVLSNYIKATDCDGNNLVIQISSIKSPDGTEIVETYNQSTSELNMTMHGIYIVTVSTVDENNRSTRGEICIPVNPY